MRGSRENLIILRDLTIYSGRYGKQEQQPRTVRQLDKIKPELVVTLTINSKGVSDEWSPGDISQHDNVAARGLLEPLYS